MVATELGQRTTARAAVFGSGSDDVLVAAMSTKLPSGGVAAPNLARRRQLPASTYRLLDGRILEAAAHFLDEDISGPFLAGLGKYRALVQAARDSLADPKQGEVVVSLIDPYQITSKQRPHISLVIDDNEVARITFELEVVFGLFETAVAVRRGAIESVNCEACALSVKLSLEGWPEPLLQRKVQLPVRLPVRPPVPIPLPHGR